MSAVKPQTGCLVFACGAKIEGAREKLHLFPVGQRYITYFTRSEGNPVRPEIGGHCAPCLMCPATAKASGRTVERAWGEHDDNPSPGFLVRCKIKAHEVPGGEGEP